MRALVTVRRLIADSLDSTLPQMFGKHLLTVRHFSDSFKYADLKVKLCGDYRTDKEIDFSDLKFGHTFSDHMFQVEWTAEKGWGVPLITPLHYFQLHPGSKILHYAQSAFEGLKAYKTSDNSVVLFRPELNMKRLLDSAKRASLPPFNKNELLRCIAKLVSIDKRWVPYKDLSSLYIRPNFIGVENALGVSSATKALLYVVTCPVGSYFSGGVAKPVSLFADPNYVRAYPGGAGAFKLGANYAPTLMVQNRAQAEGCQQVLWLYGSDRRICEAGAMNVFFFLQNENGDRELVTPPLDGTILPGVVRHSVLELSKDWNEFKVSERNITMDELISANKKKRVLEVFMSGTAAVICPVNHIQYLKESIDLPTAERKDPLYSRLLKTLTDIQYRVIESDWSVSIDKFL